MRRRVHYESLRPRLVLHQKVPIVYQGASASLEANEVLPVSGQASEEDRRSSNLEECLFLPS